MLNRADSRTPSFAAASQRFVGTSTNGRDLVVQYEETDCAEWPEDHFQVFEGGVLKEWASGRTPLPDLTVRHADGKIAECLLGRAVGTDTLSRLRVLADGNFVGFPPFDLDSPRRIHGIPEISLDIYYERIGTPVGSVRYVEEFRDGSLLGYRALDAIPVDADLLRFRSSYISMLRYRAGEIDLVRAAARGRIFGPPDLVDVGATILESAGYQEIVRSSLGAFGLQRLGILTGHFTAPIWTETQRDFDGR